MDISIQLEIYIKKNLKIIILIQMLIYQHYEKNDSAH